MNATRPGRPRLRRLLAGTCLLALAGMAGGAGALAAGDPDGSSGLPPAVASLVPLAKDGEREAQYQLGLLYDLGEGVPEDAGRAYGWYAAAARQGLPAAAFNVAVMLDSGRGVAMDRKAAAIWYAKAAAHGHQRAAFNLAQLLETGQGLAQDKGMARLWYEAAASLPAASRRLSELGPARRAPAAADEAPPAAPLPLAPAEGERVLRPAEDMAVELVWAWPGLPAGQMRPDDARVFVELEALSHASRSEIMATYVDRSAVLASLPAGDGTYAWRAIAVDPKNKSYQAGPWQRFLVEEGR